MKVLAMTQAEAKNLAENSEKEFYLSTIDVYKLDNGLTDEAQKVLDTAMGETQCYRTDDGDIFAWWE